MIFTFLRRYFRDEEFEHNKLELAKAQQTLEDYKSLLIEQTQSPRKNDFVDPEFINLVWLSIGLGIAIFYSTGNKVLEMQSVTNSITYYVWFIFAFFSFCFIVVNGFIANTLMHQYAKSKSTPIYKTFAWLLTIGTSLIVLAVVYFAVFI